MSTTGEQNTSGEKREGLRGATAADIVNTIDSLWKSGTFQTLRDNGEHAKIDTGHSVSFKSDGGRFIGELCFYGEGGDSMIFEPRGGGTGIISMRDAKGICTHTTRIEEPSPDCGDALIAAFMRLAESLRQWGEQHKQRQGLRINEERAKQRKAILKFAGIEEEPEFDR